MVQGEFKWSQVEGWIHKNENIQSEFRKLELENGGWLGVSAKHNIAFMIDEHNNSTLFQLLFSYDYFDIFHKCLCQYLKDKKQDNEVNISKKYFSELT